MKRMVSDSESKAKRKPKWGGKETMRQLYIAYPDINISLKNLEGVGVKEFQVPLRLYIFLGYNSRVDFLFIFFKSIRSYIIISRR